MKRKWLYGYAACTLALSLAAAVAGSGLGRRYWLSWQHSYPIADFPARIDMGARELNQLAKMQFAISNQGGRDLVIDQIRTNCGCSGLVVDSDGEPRKIESLRVGPGEKTRVRFIVMVHGRPGGIMQNIIAFRTNDPHLPEGTIEATVTKIRGGLVGSPATLNFGIVPVGRPARLVLDIHDGGVEQRKIGEVRSARPDRFKVRMLPKAVQGASCGSAAAEGLLGQCEVIADTSHAGPLEGEILISAAGEKRPPTIVPVLGRVIGQLEATPATLVLPRRVAGKLVDFAECYCRSNHPGPWSLRVDSAPAGWSVRVFEVKGSESLRRIRIEKAKPPDDRVARNLDATIRLRARFGKEEATTVVRILYRPRKGA